MNIKTKEDFVVLSEFVICIVVSLRKQSGARPRIYFIVILIIPGLFYTAWPVRYIVAKARAYRGPFRGWHRGILVRNRGIYPWMETRHSLRWPLPGIEPDTYSSLRNS